MIDYQKVAISFLAIAIGMGAYWGKSVDERLNVVTQVFERLGRIETKLDILMTEDK